MKGLVMPRPFIIVAADASAALPPSTQRIISMALLDIRDQVAATKDLVGASISPASMSRSRTNAQR